MPELIHACGAKLRFSEAMGGRRGKCPTCGNPVEVPFMGELPELPNAGDAPAVAMPKMRLDPPPRWDQYQAFLDGKGPAPTFSAVPAAIMLRSAAEQKWEAEKNKAPPSKYFCPGCKTRLTVGGLVCVSCGLDLRTGRSLDGKHKLTALALKSLDKVPWLKDQPPAT